MKTEKQEIKTIRIALAGQPNVGKSVIFNTITGLSQVIGNWPGKTVAKAEGTARFHNYIFKIIDLPGIYSLSTYSLEEIVSRDYILNEKPDYLINVIDSTHLERNLFFTLQLSMLNVPMIISLNQIDLLEERGYKIDYSKLEKILKFPTIPAIAVHNRGVHEILEKIIEIEEQKRKNKEKEENQDKSIKYQENIEKKQNRVNKIEDLFIRKSNKYDIKLGKEIEEQLIKIIQRFPSDLNKGNYPSKFLALKLLENDDESIRYLRELNPNSKNIIDRLIYLVGELRQNLEEIHGEQITTIINAEFYNIASQIVENVLVIEKRSRKTKWSYIFDHITLGNVSGYIIFFGLMLGIYFLVFRFGDWISGLMDTLYEIWTPKAENWMDPSSWWYKIIWIGIMGGLFAGVGGVLPYVIPFFLIIEILQDTGYLPRAAYLMDRFMHHIGVHGKTIIPILIGFGCNVPAVSAAMIMETEREKKRAILVSSMIPCSAVTTIVLGLVAKYMGFLWAVVLYIINFGVIILIGRILTRLDKSHAMDSELIIELHEFRTPNFQVILKQTWARSKEFVVMALPLIVILGIILQILMEFNLTAPINAVLYPISVIILGLPVEVGVYLFYGVLRKELNLVLLEMFVASQGLTMVQFMNPLQMLTFTLVTMLYIPCLATIITIKKETGWKFALQVMFLELGIALIFGGIMHGIGAIISILF
ncbi:MAG: ferrous iron transport protein B [Candidatus Lokiarchaeota archaeon]|nr:ferrous iron transport protein B [Candidatus Harpocratesius repetitus]